MKRSILSIVGLSLSAFFVLTAQDIWTGEKITFTRADDVDHTLAVNQDKITDNVIITRASDKGIFNIASESFFTKSSSPADTEWAFGTTDDLGSLTFSNWQSVGKPTQLLGKDMVVHLITDDIYIDIKLLTFTRPKVDPGTGGFSYERSTPATLSITDTRNPNTFNVFPSIASTFIQTSLDIANQQVYIYDLSGKVVSQFTTTSNQIDVHSLENGIYFLRVGEYPVRKFIKQ